MILTGNVFVESGVGQALPDDFQGRTHISSGNAWLTTEVFQNSSYKFSNEFRIVQLLRTMIQSMFKDYLLRSAGANTTFYNRFHECVAGGWLEYWAQFIKKPLQ